MKKALEFTLGMITVVAIFLAGAENPDGSCNIVWTLSCLAVVVLGAVLWNKTHPAPVHITSEAYSELQRQIQGAVETMQDDHEIIEIVAELPDDASIYLTVALSASTSHTKFTDDAWGATQTFTETNRCCTCEIDTVLVIDGKGNERESDFDESNLELEFETTDWS